MYDSGLIEIGQKVQFLTQYDYVINSEIIGINNKKGYFTITSGENFKIKTGKQINNRLGKIIKMTHFKI